MPQCSLQGRQKWVEDLVEWFQEIIEFFIEQFRTRQTLQGPFQDQESWWSREYQHWVKRDQEGRQEQQRSLQDAQLRLKEIRFQLQDHKNWSEDHQRRLKDNESWLSELSWSQDPQMWIQEHEALKTDTTQLNRVPVSEISPEFRRKYDSLKQKHRTLCETHDALGGMTRSTNTILTTCIEKLEQRGPSPAGEWLKARKNHLLNLYLSNPSRWLPLLVQAVQSLTALLEQRAGS